MSAYQTPEGIQINGKFTPEYAEILTPEALAFFAKLQRKHNERRKELLQKRVERQVRLDAGELPDFLPETKSIRESDWTVAPCPADIQDRRVEITGPVDRKMIINALNSGAKVFMADFEDSNAPTWENNISGQINLKDANNKTISLESNGKSYKLNDQIAALFVRPRGWHLLEKHVLVDGEVASGSIWDFALYFFHNAKQRVASGSGVYFYLPKMESHLEARLWNDIFVDAQNELGIPQGSIKATVLIETIVATFELNEILFELKEHSAGLNCGRWDYIFSFIKRTVKNKQFLVPDRMQVTMTTHFLKSYSELVIQTCHKRGAFAMGGMAAQIPIKDNPEANEIAYLLAVPAGTITLSGLKNNIDVGIQYLEAWLRGNGCVPIHNLMEDAATAEISRTQVWQWVHHEDAKLDDGTKVTAELVQQLIDEQKAAYKATLGDKYATSKFDLATELFTKMSLQDTLEEFLTLEAYNYID